MYNNNKKNDYHYKPAVLCPCILVQYPLYVCRIRLKQHYIIQGVSMHRTFYIHFLIFQINTLYDLIKVFSPKEVQFIFSLKSYGPITGICLLFYTFYWFFIEFIKMKPYFVLVFFF